MKIAQIQMKVSTDKIQNISQLAAAMDELDRESPDLITLGEMCFTPYDPAHLHEYAEQEGEYMWQAFSSLSKKHHVWLSAGTMPESDGKGHIYNTAYIFDREGNQAARHRKVHMFDVDIQGGQHYRESDTFSAGNQATVFDTEFGRIGLCICFDIRFPEMAHEMRMQGAKIILVPAQFTRKTGAAHWELLFRARAVDNQCFYIGTSTAFDENASYHSYGHSIITSPWGDVLSQMDDRPGVRLSGIDLTDVMKVREQIPLR